MEHRQSIRHKLELEVGIYHRGSWLGTCRTRDISRGGMFIRSRPEPLKRNSLIEVTFDQPGSTGVKRYRLPSLVIHGGKDGIGVMFRSQEGEAHTALQRLVAAQTMAQRCA